MRRTYKSKKDVAGGLDHREMLCNMDERSSAFDAFYIQNIKQTKREQSCLGSSNQYGVAGNKVRKKKYVKRLVKEVEAPPRESLSNSVFLTPDKSIRVNKAPDPFDQLLNSSPACSAPKQTNKDDFFEQLLNCTPKEKKTYRRKKAIVKKYNYSSNESSESDKENTSNNYSDILSHQLVIEKEAAPNPKVDESINNIVRKLSQLNRKSIYSNGGARKTFKGNRNRLTKNLQSPLLRTSPLSSTPFTEKQHQQSIYKFSPIPMGNLEDSPNYVTIVEDANETNRSIVFVTKNCSNALKRSQSEQESLSGSSHSNSIKNKRSVTSFDTSIACKNDDIQEKVKEKVPMEETESLLQTSEIEPLVGFKKESQKIYESLLLNKDLEHSLIIPTGNVSKRRTNSKEYAKITPPKTENNESHVQDDNEWSVKCDGSVLNDSNSVLDHDEIVQNVHNSAENTDESIQNAEITDQINDSSVQFYNNGDHNNEDSVARNDSIGSHVSAISDVKSSKSVQSLLDLPEQGDIVNNSVKSDVDSLQDDPVDISESENSTADDVSDNASESIRSHKRNLDNSYNLSEIASDDDGKTLYDTCSSAISLVDHERLPEPVVVLERMNVSLLNKYGAKVSNDDSESVDSSGEESFSDDFASFVTGNGSDEINDCDESQIAETDLTSAEVQQLCDGTDSDDREEECRSTDEERGISFVTTRRRYDFTNNSTILILDDSQDSVSSGECDKTVLSNRITQTNSKQDLDPEMDVGCNKNSTLISSHDEANSVKQDSDNSIMKANSLSLTVRKSYMPEESNSLQDPNISVTPEPKLGIVLQPGKRWERSLSIYRRMTTVNDHFDQSLVDEEDLHGKGRKYRQSVINTMEMQNLTGSLHNESIHSRRSTFVPKPSRSTIRIVKETSNSRISLSSTTVFEDLKGFLEDCDDTIVELSKLSIADERDVTVLNKFHENQFHDSRIATARDYVLRRCNQLDTLPFDECYPDSALKNCRKIGEGVYGEVYLWRAPDGRARVMKIVPIAGDTRVNGEQQKDFHEVISEVVIAMELSALRAPIAEIECLLDEGKELNAIDLQSVGNATDVFNEVLGVKCVFGPYPSRLLDLWELYDECRGSENDNPAALPADQQYLVLELANAGQDLESYVFNSAEQACALFVQVAFALAVGEEAYQFEHRDLHWGNVLIAPTDQKYATFVLRGRCHRVPRRGVAASIIDYSLSRVSIPLTAPTAPIAPNPGAPIAPGDSAALYNDLATDEGLFAAVGDYQFQVYRLMRDKLGNDWKSFEPYTNVLWLHYIADKMITALRYKRTNTKTHRTHITRLVAIRNSLLGARSAAEYVLTQLAENTEQLADNQY